MISIEGLLEDEQGLSMGELLTVKIRQPSHEFTFGVGISFIPYLLRVFLGLFAFVFYEGKRVFP
jgi:hypothetical protein